MSRTCDIYTTWRLKTMLSCPRNRRFLWPSSYRTREITIPPVRSPFFRSIRKENLREIHSSQWTSYRALCSAYRVVLHSFSSFMAEYQSTCVLWPVVPTSYSQLGTRNIRKHSPTWLLISFSSSAANFKRQALGRAGISWSNEKLQIGNACSLEAYSAPLLVVSR